jgi:hypothetical protein
LAVQLEFINLIVPIQKIDEIYPDGWSGCLRDHAKSIGRIVWYDDHLFRTGAMDPDMAENLIKKWTSLGLTATEMVKGQRLWKDFCVVDVFGVSRYNCPWVVIDPDKRIASMRGKEAGDVMGRA